MRHHGERRLHDHRTSWYDTCTIPIYRSAGITLSYNSHRSLGNQGHRRPPLECTRRLHVVSPDLASRLRRAPCLLIRLPDGRLRAGRRARDTIAGGTSAAPAAPARRSWALGTFHVCSRAHARGGRAPRSLARALPPAPGGKGHAGSSPAGPRPRPTRRTRPALALHPIVQRSPRLEERVVVLSAAPPEPSSNVVLMYQCFSPRSIEFTTLSGFADATACSLNE